MKSWPDKFFSSLTRLFVQAFLVMLLGVPLAQAGGLAWSPAAVVVTGIENVTSPQTAVDPSGNIMAVWVQTTGTSAGIYASLYVVGSGWSNAAALSAIPATISNPRIAADSYGNFIAVWQQYWSSAFGSYHYGIYASRYVAGTGWGTATSLFLETDLATSNVSASDPNIAVDPNGNAVAVWSVYDWAWNHSSIRASRYVAGAGWSAVTNLSSEAVQQAYGPNVAVDATGNAIVVWSQYVGTSNSVPGIHAVGYAVGTGWGTPVQIQSATTAVMPYAAGQQAQIAFDASGNAISVWNEYPYAISSNRYVAGTGWGTAETVPNVPTRAYHIGSLKFAIDRNGAAIALWDDEILFASRYVAGSGWGTPDMVEANGGIDYSGQIAFDSHANAIAVWGQGSCGLSSVMANQYVLGTGWGLAKPCWDSTPSFIDNAASAAGEPQIVIDKDGNATAVWVQNSNTIYASVANVVTSTTSSTTTSTTTTTATASTTTTVAGTTTTTGLVSNAALVSWWRAENNANDSIGTNNGTPMNGVTYASGIAGQAFNLDGVNGYVLIGDPVPGPLQIQNELSLEAWIYATEYPASNTLGLILGSQYDTGVAGASIFLDGRTSPDGQTSPAGHIHFQIGDGSWHTTNTNAQVPLNQWVHIVATRKANEDAMVYYNGTLQPSTSVAWTGSISYNGAWFAIGQQKDLSRPFKGLIDEAKIYNRALPASEVAAIYAAVVGAGGSTTTSTTSSTTAATTTTTESTTTTTLSGGGSTTLNFISGWNLVGNGNSGTLDVAATFGDPARVTTVWKWLASTANWAFYTPTLGDGGAAYAASKGYDFMTAVAGGEGFWVNAKGAFTASLPAGNAINSASFQSMGSGWNLIAIGDNKTPSAFNIAIGLTPPPAGEIAINLTTLWTWDAGQVNWYFYAPALDKSGGLAGYITSKSYLDFGSKALDSTTGFWVNKP